MFTAKSPFKLIISEGQCLRPGQIHSTFHPTSKIFPTFMLDEMLDAFAPAFL